MSIPTVYRVINKSDNKVSFYRDVNAVAAHMLGRRLSNLLVIKSDERGDRLALFTSSDVNTIARELETA